MKMFSCTEMNIYRHVDEGGECYSKNENENYNIYLKNCKHLLNYINQLIDLNFTSLHDSFSLESQKYFRLRFSSNTIHTMFLNSSLQQRPKTGSILQTSFKIKKNIIILKLQAHKSMDIAVNYGVDDYPGLMGIGNFTPDGYCFILETKLSLSPEKLKAPAKMIIQNLGEDKTEPIS